MTTEISNNILTFGDLLVDVMDGMVYACGEPVSLSIIDYRVLLVLLRNRDAITTHQQIAVAMGKEISQKYEWVEISRLRKKIACAGVTIVRVRHRGYHLAIKETYA